MSTSATCGGYVKLYWGRGLMLLVYLLRFVAASICVCFDFKKITPLLTPFPPFPLFLLSLHSLHSLLSPPPAGAPACEGGGGTCSS